MSILEQLLTPSGLAYVGLLVLVAAMVRLIAS